MNPAVTFVVPCYKLANLLPQCIESILSQTYSNFEVLIMDDCSPDNTPEVARSFGDARVFHVRHEQNIGHLRNYNEGILRARGRYIWLISADDVLRTREVLARYVQVLERYPRVGFVFCPGVALRDGIEGEVLAWSSVCGAKDRIWKGEEFLERIVSNNCVVASSGIVRKECYDKAGLFPLDLPYAGDWYLWCAFALHFDVAYLAQPMVSYRLHEVSMTNTMATRRRLADNNAVAWRIMREAEQLNYKSVVRNCVEFLVSHYSYTVACGVFATSHYTMTVDELEDSLRLHRPPRRITNRIRASVCLRLGDEYYHRGDARMASRYYRQSLAQQPHSSKVWVKKILADCGWLGMALRNNVFGSVQRSDVQRPRPGVGLK